MTVTLYQLIEWHRVRAVLAARGVLLCKMKNAPEERARFAHEMKFHLTAVKLLKAMQ